MLVVSKLSWNDKLPAQQVKVYYKNETKQIVAKSFVYNI